MAAREYILNFSLYFCIYRQVLRLRMGWQNIRAHYFLCISFNCCFLAFCKSLYKNQWRCYYRPSCKEKNWVWHTSNDLLFWCFLCTLRNNSIFKRFISACPLRRFLDRRRHCYQHSNSTRRTIVYKTNSRLKWFQRDKRSLFSVIFFYPDNVWRTL